MHINEEKASYFNNKQNTNRRMINPLSGPGMGPMDTEQVHKKYAIFKVKFSAPSDQNRV